jgi:outer membrane protein assembly factor BamB
MPSTFLYVTLGGVLHAVDTQTGAVAWETPIAAGRVQLLVHQERIYIACEFGSLEILHAATGALLKKASLSGSGHAATLLIEENKVFVTCGGELTVFDLNGGLLWSQKFKGRGNGTMALATATQNRQADEY